jgi:hypothetical protein
MRPRQQTLILGILASGAVVAVHAYAIANPLLFDDDFALVAGSWTWQDLGANLWRPWNEHAIPLSRLTTWALVQLAGRLTLVPFLTSLQGPLAVMAGMWLVYLFVSREMGHRLFGLVAMILFGVSLKYNEAVFWYSASFAILAMDTMLLGLLAAQRWRHQGRWRDLLWCAGCTALAPAWFAGGILAGPFCCLYLGGAWRVKGGGWCGSRTSRRPPPANRHPPPSTRWAFLFPLAGTVIYLGWSLPVGLHHIQHAEHFAGQTATAAFNPWGGLELAGRTVVDNLIFGVNAFGVTCPRALVPIALLVLVGGGWWWWRQGMHAPRVTPHAPRLLLLGTGFILVSYWFIYSFRTAWPYEEMMSRWTRYNLVPFLGVVLFVCGGLPGRQGSLFQLDSSGGLTRGQVRGLGLLLGLLLLLQFPLAWAGHRSQAFDSAKQMAYLRQIEDMDGRCQALGIGRDTARAALERLVIPYSGEPVPRINGWDLLRGSNCPRSLAAAEARRLLEGGEW